MSTIPGRSYFAAPRREAYLALLDVADSRFHPEDVDIDYLVHFFIDDHPTIDADAPEVISVFAPGELALVQKFGTALLDLVRKYPAAAYPSEYMEDAGWGDLIADARLIIAAMEEYGVPRYGFTGAVWSPSDGSPFK